MSKLSRRREYLQVLVRWEELCREGMPSDEPLAYCSFLLAGHDVVPAAGAVAHRAILSGEKLTLRRELAAPVLRALPPPAPEATIKRNGRAGKSCAKAVAQSAKKPAPNKKPARILRPREMSLINDRKISPRLLSVLPCRTLLLMACAAIIHA